MMCFDCGRSSRSGDSEIPLLFQQERTLVGIPQTGKWFVGPHVEDRQITSIRNPHPQSLGKV